MAPPRASLELPGAARRRAGPWNGRRCTVHRGLALLWRRQDGPSSTAPAWRPCSANRGSARPACDGLATGCGAGTSGVISLTARERWARRPTSRWPSCCGGARSRGDGGGPIHRCCASAGWQRQPRRAAALLGWIRPTIRVEPSVGARCLRATWPGGQRRCAGCSARGRWSCCSTTPSWPTTPAGRSRAEHGRGAAAVICALGQPAVARSRPAWVSAPPRTSPQLDPGREPPVPLSCVARAVEHVAEPSRPLVDRSGGVPLRLREWCGVCAAGPGAQQRGGIVRRRRGAGQLPIRRVRLPPALEQLPGERRLTFSGRRARGGVLDEELGCGSDGRHLADMFRWMGRRQPTVATWVAGSARLALWFTTTSSRCLARTSATRWPSDPPAALVYSARAQPRQQPASPCRHGRRRCACERGGVLAAADAAPATRLPGGRAALYPGPGQLRRGCGRSAAGVAAGASPVTAARTTIRWRLAQAERWRALSAIHHRRRMWTKRRRSTGCSSGSARATWRARATCRWPADLPLSPGAAGDRRSLHRFNRDREAAVVHASGRAGEPRRPIPRISSSPICCSASCCRHR